MDEIAAGAVRERRARVCAAVVGCLASIVMMIDTGKLVKVRCSHGSGEGW